VPLREERLEILRAETRELEKYLSDLPEEAWGPTQRVRWVVYRRRGSPPDPYQRI